MECRYILHISFAQLVYMNGLADFCVYYNTNGTYELGDSLFTKPTLARINILFLIEGHKEIDKLF